MYEIDRDCADQLHPETLRRMQEVFDGHTCTACSAPAARLCGGEFYCHAHFPRLQKRSHTPRVYRCLASVDG